jgi:hypothetical protein
VIPFAKLLRITGVVLRTKRRKCIGAAGNGCVLRNLYEAWGFAISSSSTRPCWGTKLEGYSQSQILFVKSLTVTKGIFCSHSTERAISRKFRLSIMALKTKDQYDLKLSLFLSSFLLNMFFENRLTYKFNMV